jgi:hypothetical protein
VGEGAEARREVAPAGEQAPEIPAGPGRKDAEGHRARIRARAQQAIDHFIVRPVAAEREHRRRPALDGPARKLDRVPRPLGGEHRHLAERRADLRRDRRALRPHAPRRRRRVHHHHGGARAHRPPSARFFARCSL